MVTTRQRTGGVRASDMVRLDVPADPAYLAVVRTATAGLAARLNFTLDQIEDLRIAVDEACALLIDHRPHPGYLLTSEFTLTPGSFDVVFHGPVTDLPRRSTYSWSVLAALVRRVDTGTSADGCWIRLHHSRDRRG